LGEGGGVLLPGPATLLPLPPGLHTPSDNNSFWGTNLDLRVLRPLSSFLRTKKKKKLGVLSSTCDYPPVPPIPLTRSLLSIGRNGNNWPPPRLFCFRWDQRNSHVYYTCWLYSNVTARRLSCMPNVYQPVQISTMRVVPQNHGPICKYQFIAAFPLPFFN